MRLRLALGAVLVVVLSVVAATGVASAAPPNNLTCTGGIFTGDPTTSTFTMIPSGNYSSITVTGVRSAHTRSSEKVRRAARRSARSPRKARSAKSSSR